MNIRNGTTAFVLAVGSLGLVGAGSTPAAEAAPAGGRVPVGPVAEPVMSPPPPGPLVPRVTADAILQVTQAVNTVDRMMMLEPELADVVRAAEGVFVITRYSRVALGLGIRSGDGVLMVNQQGRWSYPLFYNFGGVSAGLQAGIEGGSVVMILTNRLALDRFLQDRNWSLNADAGLTVYTWAARAQAAGGTGDVIVWSDAGGLMADLAVSVTSINHDERTSMAYYGRPVTADDVLAGNVEVPHQFAGQE
jgi:SH3 domain-containing YSC84-like protein 1